jgi:uncharacterized membrane protein
MQFLATLTTVTVGTVAGVFFAVTVSVMPALAVLPADRYVLMHRLLGRGYHPVMPAIVTFSFIATVVLAAAAPTTAVRVLTVAAAVLLAGVSYVSEFRNVPINRLVGAVDVRALPEDWPDPRAAWRNWHWLRTAFAFAAFGSICVATALW